MESSSFSSQDLHNDIVGFNVGGFVFQTKKATLSRKPLHKNELNYFQRLLKGEIAAEKDKEGNIFIDRDAECMKVILTYLRTDELDAPPNIRLYDLERESLFYNIEIPKATARKSHRKKIELHQNGIYVSESTRYYYKVLNSHKLLRGLWGFGARQTNYRPQPFSYKIQRNELIFPEYYTDKKFILEDGKFLLDGGVSWCSANFVESKPIDQQISEKFPFKGKKSGKPENVRVCGTHIDVTDSKGQIIAKVDAELNPQDVYVGRVNLHGAEYIVELYDYFVHITSIAKDKTKRVPKTTGDGQNNKEKKDKENNEE